MAKAQVSSSQLLIGVVVLVIVVGGIITLFGGNHRINAQTALGKVLATDFPTQASITSAVVEADQTIEIHADWLGSDLDKPTDKAGWAKIGQDMADRLAANLSKHSIHLVLDYRGQQVAEATAK